MAFRSEPLPGGHAFGAVIRDLTPAAIDDPQCRRDLYDLWIERGVLVFKGMTGGRDTQLRLSRVFGELEIHPVVEARMPEQPELTALVYTPGAGAVVALDGEERGAYLPWHSDLIYVDRINRGGLLRPIRIPSRGGCTGFIDQIERYAALSDELKEHVAGLDVIYHYDPSAKKFGRQIELRHGGIPFRRAAPEKYPHVAHPMVFVQAETGRRVLNVSPWFAVAIEDMEDAEGDALLARIVGHCEDESRAYYHDWQPDDLVLWDNWRMLHGCSGVPRDEVRRVERTTIEGDYKLGRIVRPAAVSGETLRVDV